MVKRLHFLNLSLTFCRRY